MIRAVYRNLNKAKRNPETFVWTVATVSKTGNSPRVERYEYDEIRLANPSPRIKAKGLERVRAKAVREVAAWVVGEVLEGAREFGVYRQITLNPLPASRGGRGEVEFVYCSTDLDGLVIEEPVQWADVVEAVFTSCGASVRLRGAS